MVTPNCVTKASRVTRTQTVSSYSENILEEVSNLKQEACNLALKDQVLRLKWIKKRKLSVTSTELSVNVGQDYYNLLLHFSKIINY
jgi:hypothetical protein